MFEPFQKFIDKAAQSHGVAMEVKAATICQNFRSLIPEIFKGKPEPEKHIKPACYKNSTLIIETENPAWSQEVILRKEKIIEEVNKKAGRQAIRNLRTQLTDPRETGRGFPID